MLYEVLILDMNISLVRINYLIYECTFASKLYILEVFKNVIKINVLMHFIKIFEVCKKGA